MRTSKRYGVAELVALLADLARPVTDAAAAEGITGRAVRERTHRAAAWVVALVTGRQTAARTVATVVVDDGRRNSPRVVWADRPTPARVVRPYRRTQGVGAAFDPTPAPVAAPGFRAVAWEPADLMTSPADPAFNTPAAAPAPVPSSVDVWGTDLPKSRRVRRPAVVPVAVADESADVPAELPTPPAVADEFIYAADLTPPAVEPVKPTRKPRTRKPAAPKVKTMSSAARVTAPPAVEPVATVYTADVRPLPLLQLLRHGIGRFGAAATVRAGWVTDSKVMIRVAEADREALAAKVEDNGGRPVPAADVIAATIDPRPFTLTGREWDGDQEPVGVLTREDGETYRVELRLLLTLLRHSPKGATLYAAPGRAPTPATDRRHHRPAPTRPLVAFAGDPVGYARDGAAGVLMPLVADGSRYTPWHADDEPLTLRGGRGAGSTYTLTRGQWRALLAFLTGATAADLEAASGKVALTAKERGKLAPVIDAAGGRSAVAGLLSDREGAAAAA